VEAAIIQCRDLIFDATITKLSTSGRLNWSHYQYAERYFLSQLPETFIMLPSTFGTIIDLPISPLSQLPKALVPAVTVEVCTVHVTMYSTTDFQQIILRTTFDYDWKKNVEMT
jgi:hypothetical protein